MFAKEDSGHNISHLKRVLKNAERIQKVEGGDIFIISVSALLHDIHRLMSNQLGEFVPPENSLGAVERFLNLTYPELPATTKNHIIKVIKHHGEKDYTANESLESKIVKDADCLDAMGKIGLKRTRTYCRVHNIPVVNLNYSLNCKEYIPDVNPISCCHYIYRTMLPDINTLRTNTAKAMAKRKNIVLENFVAKNVPEYKSLKNKN